MSGLPDIKRLDPGTNTKHEYKGEALGRSTSLNLVYTPIHHQELLDHFQEANFQYEDLLRKKIGSHDPPSPSPQS